MSDLWPDGYLANPRDLDLESKGAPRSLESGGGVGGSGPYDALRISFELLLNFLWVLGFGNIGSHSSRKNIQADLMRRVQAHWMRSASFENWYVTRTMTSITDKRLHLRKRRERNHIQFPVLLIAICSHTLQVPQSVFNESLSKSTHIEDVKQQLLKNLGNPGNIEKPWTTWNTI